MLVDFRMEVSSNAIHDEPNIFRDKRSLPDLTCQGPHAW